MFGSQGNIAPIELQACPQLQEAVQRVRVSFGGQRANGKMSRKAFAVRCNYYACANHVDVRICVGVYVANLQQSPGSLSVCVSFVLIGVIGLWLPERSAIVDDAPECRTS